MKNYKEDFRANTLFYNALVFAREFSGTSRDLDKALLKEFNLSAVVRTEIINLVSARKEVVQLRKLLDHIQFRCVSANVVRIEIE